MTDISSILTTQFPPTEERIEGRLVFLTKYDVTKLDKKKIQLKTGLELYKARFFTGYRKFTEIDVIVGLLTGNDPVFLLTHPIFSDRFSNLIEQLEKIAADDVDRDLVTEIVEIFRETGATITEVEEHKYQIWFGDSKWRILEFETDGTLKIKTTPNGHLSKEWQSRWKDFL